MYVRYTYSNIFLDYRKTSLHRFFLGICPVSCFSLVFGWTDVEYTGSYQAARRGTPCGLTMRPFMFPKRRYAWRCMKISIWICMKISIWICVPTAVGVRNGWVLLNRVLCQIALGFRYDLPMKPSGTQTHMTVIISLQLPRSCFNECDKIICMQNQIRQASKQWCSPSDVLAQKCCAIIIFWSVQHSQYPMRIVQS